MLNVLLEKAVEWDVIERTPCVIGLLPIPKASAAFYDFEEFERLVKATEGDVRANVIVLRGGEAGLRRRDHGAGMKDIDLHKRQLCVARSDWKGHVTLPKGGGKRVLPRS